MLAGREGKLLFRFGCASAAVTLLAIPSMYALGSWQASLSGSLHDTYYVTPQVEVFLASAALAIVHHIGAMVCALLSDGRTGALRSGWLLSGSALLLVFIEIMTFVVTVMTVASPPARYFDLAAGERPGLAWVLDLAPCAYFVVVVAMAIGWLLLAFSRPRKSAQAEE